MAGAGKTLKVSYGSFSCTLEGFDDPVATLRSITEHFQSLSSPERLFAAEGPVPAIDLMLPVPEGGEAGPVLPDPAPRTDAESAARRTVGVDRDADVSRLMDQTIGQMQGEEQRRRQATIGHLKAAVAATADDPAAGLGGDPARAARYRADLASVVRPTRAAPPRLPPVPERQSPLLLVPELRVPLPPDMPQAPPEPEPAASSMTPGATPDFAIFAARIDAAGLPDLIEAAGAFVICAEGASAFTRPDLMRHLSALPGPRGGTPEDQMRGFGLLLRHGRILRAGRGTFTLRDDAPVLARARRLLG
jgi:hypothetical protein